MDYIALREKLRTGSPPAPGNLVLLEGFLNTSSDELGFDDLETAKSTEAWLRSFALWTGAKKITSEEHQKIIEFRAALRAWILDKERLEPLNELITEVAFRAEFGPGGEVRFRSTGDVYHQSLGTLIGVISESLQDGTWDRLKCCDLPTCGWAFYDSTRSRTKRWCSMKTCGSRHKSREYYKRRR
jgi:predicted RNA-binding Zn ribbon-like protein